LQSEEVLIAAGICAAVCLSITIFSLQTKWDITSSGVCKGFLFVSLIVLLMFGIMAICMQDKVVNLVYASLGALVFSIYLVFDTQLMLGGKHRYSISPEEYVFAALNLYLDIVNIFIYILAIVGGSSR
jgi:FtsH-binding integral membrane protein